MEPLTALVDLGGSIVSGIASYFAADRQASAIEHASDNQLKGQLGWYDTLKSWFASQERQSETEAWFGRDVAWSNADVQRTRIFYNFQAATALRGAIVAVAGAGLIALAVFAAGKEGT